MSTSENGEGSVELFHRNIKAGDNVLIRLPNGEVRAIKMDPKGQVHHRCCRLCISHRCRGEKSLNLGKFGIFRPKELIGQPYGLSYEIQADRSLKVLPPRRLEEFGTDPSAEVENYW
jgi:tRNA (adenine-N(1)-)-methyltransferase non-catalytic subunit